MSEIEQNVFVTEEQAFHTTLTVSKGGFYRVRADYAHSNWDAWLKLTIVGEAGETVTSVPPLPKKYTESTMILPLFAGENRISLAPRFDQPVDIHTLKIVDGPLDLKPAVTPSADYFYLSEPWTRRLVVESYTGAPVKITAGEQEIPFELESKEIYDYGNPAETKEPLTYHHLRLHPNALMALGEGVHELKIHLPENETAFYRLTVEKARKEYDLKIISLDVNHGNCVLLRLPNGKNLMIDTGAPGSAQKAIFPYLQEQGIGIDYLVISHYHGDHMGCLDEVLAKYPLVTPAEEEARARLGVADPGKRAEYLSKFTYLDNKTLCRYDRLDKIWDLGGVEITILNCKYESDGSPVTHAFGDENETSVSMLVKYKGFQYYHGADNHAPNQQRNLSDFTAAGRRKELECHYMQANHHFHGDMLPEMIRAINPVAVVVPADQAIYSRSAFMVDYLQSVVQTDYENKRLADTFVSYMSGTVMAFANGEADWHYETW